MLQLIRNLSAKSWRKRCLGIAVVALTLSACTTAPLSPVPPKKSALAVAACPKRGPISDDTLGGWVRLAFTLGEMYDQCREAALQER